MPVSRGRARSKTRRPKRGSLIRDVFASAVSASDRLMDEVVDQAIGALPSHCRRDVVTDPETSLQLLHECRTALEKLAADLASELDTYTWLFYLRRTPDEVFAGRLNTTAPYRRMMAEVLSARTTRTGTFAEPAAERRVIPALSRPQAEAVVRLAHLTGGLSTIHAALRRAGKGQHVRWHPDELPWVVPDAGLDAAIERYDRRMEGVGLLSAGTQVATFHPFFVSVDPQLKAAELLLSVQPVPRRTPVPVWKGPAGEPSRVTGRPGAFVVGAESLSSAVRLLAGWAGDGWGSPELSAVVLLLRSLFFHTWTEDWGEPFSRTLTEAGYLVLPSQSLSILLEAPLRAFRDADLGLGKIALPESGAAAVRTLREFRPSAWPLDPGPPLRNAGDQTIVDLRSASLWLERLLTVDKDAPAALTKARATHFEELVQYEIDATPAAPPTELRKMRGRDLRLKGNMVTDADALAVIGDVLLVVSCKSIPRTPDLDAGFYARVRNVRTDLEKYDSFWQERMEILRASPRGDNYDFRGFDIVGVVCTPSVEFTYAEQFRPVLGDLAAVVSLGELKEYLSHLPLGAAADQG